MIIKSRRPTAWARPLMHTAAIGALAWGSNYGITPGTLGMIE